MLFVLIFCAAIYAAGGLLMLFTIRLIDDAEQVPPDLRRQEAPIMILICILWVFALVVGGVVRLIDYIKNRKA